MFIEHGDFLDRSRVLQLRNGLLFHAQNDHIFTLHGDLEKLRMIIGKILFLNFAPYRRGAFIYGFHGIFDLEQMAVRGEDCQGTIVAHLKLLSGASGPK